LLNSRLNTLSSANFLCLIIVVPYLLSVNTMSERSYNLRPRAKTRSQSETRPSFGHEPSTPTGRTESPTTLTGEKRPAPGQHPVPEVVGIAPRSEMRSRPVLSLKSSQHTQTVPARVPYVIAHGARAGIPGRYPAVLVRGMQMGPRRVTANFLIIKNYEHQPGSVRVPCSIIIPSGTRMHPAWA